MKFWNNVLSQQKRHQILIKSLSFFPGPHYKESRRDRRYSEQTFGLSIVLTALLALVIGFALGLLTPKNCCQEPKVAANEIYDKTLNFTK